MAHNRIITENQLDLWVRGNARDAQGVIVELVWRLVAASTPKPKERHFSLGDSIEQPGPDAFLNTVSGFAPFVPEGRSFWEIGTGEKAGVKATNAYRKRTKATPPEVRGESTFIFVTPLSGRKDWPYTWKQNGQAKWIVVRRHQNQWRDVRVIDGSGLIDWLYHFQPVELWLAEKMGHPAQGIETPEHRWGALKSIGDPPPLTPHVFLANREKACEKLKEVLCGTTLELKLETHFPEQVVNFVCAFLASMSKEAMIDALGRCLIVSTPSAWSAMTALPESHTFIADFVFDDADGSTITLLQEARRARHAVIYGGPLGGIPHPNRVPIPSPKGYQIKEALEKAGYTEERARILAQKSDGNLTSLLRCLQNLSLMPEWTQGTDGAEMAIAELLGSWRENSEADKTIVERLSKKAYGEWIGRIREISFHPGTPLTQREGVWKIVARYEAWYALGPRLFDEHLDRLKECVVRVLREQDPRFDLSPDERYTASIHGKVLTHSDQLRKGLAESLALLGSHPKALESCSASKAEGTAVLAVRGILSGANWMLWASLNDVLPLLAEAGPVQFLDAVEEALRSDPCPFDTLFAQERPAIIGANYMTGLLWAMETLAWDAQYLTRVVVILGELARRDPGGNWGNRPKNSLSTILLAWLPQTCASVERRRTAVATLMQELPDVAWTLLLDLLPSGHQISSGSRRPAWREIIPESWSERVTLGEYWQQVDIYVELAVNGAKSDPSKLCDLVDRLDDLPPQTREQILAHLGSDAATSMSQTDRLTLWTKLADIVLKHRKFADAEWAMKPEEVNEIAAVAERLAPDSPELRYRRLFTERSLDLYEERGNYEEQGRKLEEQRQKAIDEIFTAGGMQAVLDFVKAVESPWRVGAAFGLVAEKAADQAILPKLVETESKPLAQFTGGFILGRFRARGWQWVDEIDTSQWTPAQIGQLLAYLPFTHDAWERSARLLSEGESPYWTKANANPYDTDEGLQFAVDRLIEQGRPHAAIGCLQGMLFRKQPLDTQQAVRALLAGVNSSESVYSIDTHNVIDLIKGLQDDPNTNPDDLFQVEWAYLPLLDRLHGAPPKTLEQRLADDPGFFCDIIRIVFRSKNDESAAKEVTQQQKDMAANAYHLLRGWQTPPGSQRSHPFDGSTLSAWLIKVNESCAESGHLKVALIMVGHVLVYTPPDPDGLWIHHSAAAALNAPDATDMREGFQTELFNSRGVHGFTAGKEERELAKKYRTQAEAVESHGYHRLADSLRRLAASYERDAEHEESRDPFDD